MLTSHKKVRNKYYDTSGEKYCLTPEEIAGGLTIPAKLDKECFGFFRLDQLFGNRQNIRPSVVLEPEVDDEAEDSFFIFDDHVEGTQEKE